MFPFLFGVFGLAPFFDELFGINKSNFMTDFKLSDEAFKFLGEFEAFSSKPYLLKGEKKLTIGIGSTRIFSNDGLSSRDVKPTDRLTKEQAIFQLKMYYNNPSSPKQGIDAIIKLYDFKLNQRFYDMLCQCSYASGSFHRNASFRSTYIGMLQKANGSNDVEMLGDLIKNTWIFYVKNYTSTYGINGLGWSRRAFAASQYVKGLTWSKLNAERLIKKPY